MMRKLAAVAAFALLGLTACSDDPAVDTPPDDAAASAAASNEASASEDAASEEGDGMMTVEDGVVTSTDGRYRMTIVDGWQAYPAPLDDRVNLTVLLISDVNNAEFAANLIGTWADASIEGVPTSYEEWRGAAGNVFTGEGVTIDEAEPLEIDGMSVDGLIVSREVEDVAIKQLVYPIFTDDGFQEVAFSASPEVFDENVEDAVTMMESLEMN